jgi:TetR/AcrR family transcriptional regulator, transcriptional repressor for nem operon
MAKGEISREFIIAASVPVFNTKGYTGTSLQDIMDITGFTKGGIYRHFSSKEELAAASFSYAYEEMKKAYMASADIDDAPDVKLLKFLTKMKTYLLQPPVKGGCPILNSSTEVDDTNEVLRDLVQKAALDWETRMIYIFEKGVTEKLFPATLDVKKEARFFMSAIEGAILLCKLHQDIEYGYYTLDALIQRVQDLKR